MGWPLLFRVWLRYSAQIISTISSARNFASTFRDLSEDDFVENVFSGRCYLSLYLQGTAQSGCKCHDPNAACIRFSVVRRTG